MLRRSTVAVSTLVPALKVLSTVLLDSTFFSLVRTKAGPLPGLTCWNSTTDQSWPSMLRTMPFLRSFVVAMRACQPSYVEESGCRPGRPGQQRTSLSADRRGAEPAAQPADSAHLARPSPSSRRILPAPSTGAAV